MLFLLFVQLKKIAMMKTTQQVKWEKGIISNSDFYDQWKLYFLIPWEKDSKVPS